MQEKSIDSFKKISTNNRRFVYLKSKTLQEDNRSLKNHLLRGSGENTKSGLLSVKES